MKNTVRPPTTSTKCARSCQSDSLEFSFSFSPPTSSRQILNFGLPAPIDVAITGINTNGNFASRRKSPRIRHVPGAVDVHVQQALDEPPLHLDIDRSRAQAVGLQAKDVAQNLLVSLSSSFQTAPAFWLDPKNGVSYNVAVQTPQYRIDTYQALLNTPITAASPTVPSQIIGNLTTTTTTSRPAVVNHYNVQRMINVYAAVNGRDLGSVADEVQKIRDEAEPKLPRGSHDRGPWPGSDDEGIRSRGLPSASSERSSSSIF